MSPRVRIAPSPTGYFHLGTARVALFNYLFARKNTGTFVVRIEDTDIERSDAKFTRDILEGLKWLGMTWDEGPEVGGSHEPYEQSKRTETYKDAIAKLSQGGHLYECFCTLEELEHERIEAAKQKQPPKYSGACRDLTDKDRARFREQERNSILRLRVPEKIISFNDHIRGELKFDTALIGDIAVARDEATPLYNLAVVVDDETMKITHVIRGEDHISNTPKQILLIEALGYAVPEYAHLPLILNADKSKLSKRKNKVSLNDFRADGYLPEAMVNFMAFLGWNPKSKQEIFSLQELANEFDLANVNKAGAVFDTEKLDWMNGEYIKAMDLAELEKLVEPFFPKELPKNMRSKVLAVQKSRMKTLKDVGEEMNYFYKTITFPAKKLLWKKMTPKQGINSLTIAYEVCTQAEKEYESPEAMETYLKGVIKERDLNTGEFLWPLRVALTGKERSHSPFETAYVLGKKETLKRIQHSKKLLGKQ